jgi:hypothetical protein
MDDVTERAPPVLGEKIERFFNAAPATLFVVSISIACAPSIAARRP